MFGQSQLAGSPGARKVALTVFWCILGTIFSPAAISQNPDSPIWTPLGALSEKSEGTCHFRKQFTLVRPEKAALSFAASGRTAIFINGHPIPLPLGDAAEQVDVSRMMRPGVNLIAVRVHGDSKTPFLSMHLRVKETSETAWRTLTTDESWRTHRQPDPGWTAISLSELGWGRAVAFAPADPLAVQRETGELPIAQAIGGRPVSVDQIAGFNVPLRTRPDRPLPSTIIDLDPPIVASNQEPIEWAHAASPLESADADSRHLAQTPYEQSERDSAEPIQLTDAESSNEPGPDASADDDRPTEYQVAPGFEVEAVLSDDETRSIIAMAFNEFGMLVLSQEGGPLLLADTNQPAGNRIRVACDQLRNCQGILAFNGNLYVTGDGPQGLALYELTFDSRSNAYRIRQALVRFMGQPGEHGPHGVVLGPDGMLYIAVGSASNLAGPWPPHSPLNQSFDTDLLPKHEDPGGHAAGVKAPGGTIVRVSIDGKRIEMVAGGLRNTYDLAFNAAGDLFVHDADMESDLGLPWYQPTLIYHVAHGSDMGWRSGWSRSATYLPDTIPALAETGRGSPTGAVSYRHVQFPSRFADAIFWGDWSAGRILVTRPTRQGSSYTCTPEVFLQATPLNVTDLDVGEDGSLYFCTGGRGTRGGVYRVRWTGEISADAMTFKNNVDRVTRHPQPSAAWARQNLAILSQSEDSEWSEKLLAAARDRSLPPAARAQALEAIVFYCGLPDLMTLQDLSEDYSELVRARFAQLCGFDKQSTPLLERLLEDRSPFVIRHACESYLRLHATPPPEKLISLFALCALPQPTANTAPNPPGSLTRDIDRHLQTAIRRVLERIPADQWWPSLAQDQVPAIWIQCALALVSAQPTADRCREVVAHGLLLLDETLSESEMVDLLRLLQIACSRESLDEELARRLSQRLAEAFPSRYERVNRELTPLLVRLQVSSAQPGVVEYLARSPDSWETKTLIAMQWARGANWLDDPIKLALLDTLHQARLRNPGGTYRLYLQRAIRETAVQISTPQVATVIERGAEWVEALIPMFYKLTGSVTPDDVARLIALDGELRESEDDSAATARLGVIALLAESSDESAQEHLRWCWRHEPKRRNELAYGLSRHPEGKNWSYLVSSLAQLDDLTCVAVVDQLTKVPLRPANALQYRELLETGYRLQDASANKVCDLLEHWTQMKLQPASGDWRARLDAWRAWYQQQWPAETPVSLPTTEKIGKYSVQQILQHWSANARHANAERGQQAFVKANCVQCHRVGTVGDSSGPDLSALGRRFSRREAVEAIIDPSRVIPDRYRSSLLLDDRGMQYIGLLTDNGDSYTVLQEDGRRVRVEKERVDQIRQLETSVMPSGLLDSLSLTEITDLMTYLMGETTTQIGQHTTSPDRR